MDAIEIEGLGKRYNLGATHEKYRRLSESIVNSVKRAGRRQATSDSEHWAIRDLTLDVGEGEVVGFVGRNGAGKSTLLKLLSRVTEPTEGTVRLRGRVGALLEVGTGFHPELSGRENIYLNGAILGMTRRDIRARFDQIVEFSEIERFLDTPVKRYSSGMYVRLAFAVAAHLEPDILLVDEVLAVGDAAFQRKCIGKMEQVAGEGRTVLFVSHNMTTVQNLCERAYLLEKGRLVDSGDARTVVGAYLRGINAAATVSLSEREDRQGDGTARFTHLRIDGRGGQPTVASGSGVRFTIDYESDRPLRNPRFLIQILDVNRNGVYLLDSEVRGGLPDEMPAKGRITCQTAPLMVTAGRCYVNLRLIRTGVLADLVVNAGVLDIIEDDPLGLGEVPSRDWSLGVIGQAWNPAPPQREGLEIIDVEAS